MASSGDSRTRAKAWLLVALLLGERTIAIRLAADEANSEHGLQDDTLTRRNEDAPVLTPRSVHPHMRLDYANPTSQARSVNQLKLNEGPEDGALLTANSVHPNLGADHTYRAGKPAKLHELNEAYKDAKMVETQTTCGELTTRMVGETAQAKTYFKIKACIEPYLEVECDFTRLNADEMLFGYGAISSLISAADRKKCLPQVLGDEQVREQLHEVLSFVPQLLHAASTEDGRARVQETYLQLVTWQEGVQGLEDSLVNRQLLLGHDALEGSGCPKPCGMCDDKGSSSFGFRCMLFKRDKGKVPDVAGGVTCSKAKRRGWHFLKKYKFARQCEVNDWKESALQHLHVSAMLSCASITLLIGVNGLITQSRRRELYRTCLKVEQGNALSETEEKDYQDQLSVDDGVVPKGVELALTLIIVFGLAYGLGGLRYATRDNVGQSVLLEGGMREMTPEDFYAPFAAFLTSEEPPLEIRSLDLWTYNDQALIQRDETLHKLEVCGDMYNMRSQDTFAEAMAPIVVRGLSKNGGLHAQDDDVAAAAEGWSLKKTTQVIFAGAIGTFATWMWATLLDWLFLIPRTALGWVPIVGPIIWAAQIIGLVWGGYNIYTSVFSFLGNILGVKNAEEKLEQCMEDAVLLGH